MNCLRDDFCFILRCDGLQGTVVRIMLMDAKVIEIDRLCHIGTALELYSLNCKTQLHIIHIFFMDYLVLSSFIGRDHLRERQLMDTMFSLRRSNVAFLINEIVLL